MLRRLIEIPNVFGGKPFDADVYIYLEEINKEDDNYVLRYERSVDEKQLMAAATEYVTNIARKIEKPVPKDFNLKEMVHETWLEQEYMNMAGPSTSYLPKQ